MGRNGKMKNGARGAVDAIEYSPAGQFKLNIACIFL